MSFVVAVPEFLAVAASDLADIASAVVAANTAAAAPTAGVLAAGADEVSAAIAAVFAEHATGYQTLSAQAAEFHRQFVQLLDASAGITPSPRPLMPRRCSCWSSSFSTSSMRPPRCCWVAR
ncbi:PE family protein [Mycobacterium kansasii]|uniref:PE family protein n=1 Tax=Mycobacterium kansasii TaxID=1768 RepID=A0A1V3XMP0_MYCKA|nr:PE family protein [Mycobacterium kansasii]